MMGRSKTSPFTFGSRFQTSREVSLLEMLEIIMNIPVARRATTGKPRITAGIVGMFIFLLYP
jgi:hypothetical protein